MHCSPWSHWPHPTSRTKLHVFVEAPTVQLSARKLVQQCDGDITFGASPFDPLTRCRKWIRESMPPGNKWSRLVKGKYLDAIVYDTTNASVCGIWASQKICKAVLFGNIIRLSCNDAQGISHSGVRRATSEGIARKLKLTKEAFVQRTWKYRNLASQLICC